MSNPAVKQLELHGTVYDIQVESVNNCNPTAAETSKYDWIGTQAEYIAQDVQINHPNWVCFITDDISDNISSTIDLSNYVKRTNNVNETITGTKTFDTGIQIVRTSGQRLVTRKDSNGVDIGTLECVDGGASNRTELFVFSEDGSNNAIMGINYNNGSPYSYAPTPSALSNNNEIATTSYITTILSTLYPVGSLYLGTQTTCPLATLIPGSTWTLVSSGKALWTGTGSNGNSTINAGLPNITATFGSSARISAYNTNTPSMYGTGAVTVSNRGTNNNEYSHVAQSQGANYAAYGYDFNASNSSSIYGNSTTVQPPAYVTNVWRRTA